MTQHSKISSWLFKGASSSGSGEASTESGNPSWHWATPRPFYSPQHRSPGPPLPPPPHQDTRAQVKDPKQLISPPRTPSPGPPAPPPDPQVELVGWRERRGSVQSSVITRTTHYDAREGGFVTEVSTEAVDRSRRVEEEEESSSRGSEGRLTLSTTQHHTLPRMRGGEDERLDEERPRSQGELPGSLVVQAPNFVTSIAVVSRSGSLLSLTSLDSCLSSSASSTARVEARNHRLHASTTRRAMGREQGSTLMANSGFVTNIQFGSLSLERGRVGALGRRVHRPAMDSLVTGSLLSLTRPRRDSREDRRRNGPGKLSSYVLEEREEGKMGNQGEMVGSDDRETDEFDTKELSATVLDKGEEITSLYRTISRKRLLRQYKDFQIPEGEEEEYALRMSSGNGLD